MSPQINAAIEVQAFLKQYRSAYVGAAVTEIASFRAQLSGPQVG